MNLNENEAYNVGYSVLDASMVHQENVFEVIYSIAKLLNQSSGQQEILQKSLNALEDQLGMRRTTLMLLSPDGSELHLEATRNILSETHKEIRYQRGEGIIGRVFEHGKPEIIPRISQEPNFRSRIYNRDHEKTEDLSFICVPILMEQDIVGTLSADLPYMGEQTLTKFQKILSIIASMIGYDVKARRTMYQERQSMQAEHLRLRSALGERFRPENIIGNSNAMRKVYERIHQVAKNDTTVLIRGESGTGKELVASAIHYASSRADKPFIRVNCSALSESLIESELFGHERGSFTGASSTRRGRLEEADGGTLFLDEIGEFTLTTQVKLLRVLQEKEFERVGSNRTIKSNIRILAATNSDLEKSVQQGLFRQDLFYRINVFPIYLPALRERKNDILLLADHFCQKYSKRMDKQIQRISTTAINMMLAYHWPGNVRELENCIEHAVVLSESDVIHGHNLPPTLQMPDIGETDIHSDLASRIKQVELDMIIDAVKSTNGNLAAAARQVGLTPRKIRYKVEKYNIDIDSIIKK